MDAERLPRGWEQGNEGDIYHKVNVILFQARGIDVQETSRRMKSKRPGAQMEIDIFAVDGDVAVAIEVKSRLSQRDVFEYIFNNLRARPYLHSDPQQDVR